MPEATMGLVCLQMFLRGSRGIPDPEPYVKTPGFSFFAFIGCFHPLGVPISPFRLRCSLFDVAELRLHKLLPCRNGNLDTRTAPDTSCEGIPPSPKSGNLRGISACPEGRSVFRRGFGERGSIYCGPRGRRADRTTAWNSYRRSPPAEWTECGNPRWPPDCKPQQAERSAND
jgi:hypothetical protein